jgi:hypothetical protein
MQVASQQGQPRELPEIVTTLDRHGFQTHFHAVGDRAVRMALDACGQARQVNVWRAALPQLSFRLPSSAWPDEADLPSGCWSGSPAPNCVQAGPPHRHPPVACLEGPISGQQW